MNEHQGRQGRMLDDGELGAALWQTPGSGWTASVRLGDGRVYRVALCDNAPEALKLIAAVGRWDERENGHR